MLKNISLKTMDDVNADDPIPLMTYACPSSDGRVIPLMPDGGDIPLTRKDCLTYIQKASEYRLQETAVQVQCIIEGLTSIIPMPILSLLTGNRLEQLVCGSCDIDVATLKKLARYTVLLYSCSF